jgi:hypothetical protein
MILIADAESALRTGGMFVVLIWAYFRFARGRVFRPRLEMTISGTPTKHLECYHVIVRYTVKNIGLRRVVIAHAGSDVTVEVAHPAAPTAMIPPNWCMQGSHPILKDYRRIEPGDAIAEEIMIILPDTKAIALRLVMRLEGKKLVRLGGNKAVWFAQSAATLPYEVLSPAGGDMNVSPSKPRLPLIAQPDTETAAIEAAIGNL